MSGSLHFLPKIRSVVIGLICILLCAGLAAAQDPCSAETMTQADSSNPLQCPNGIPMTPGSFHAVPLQFGDGSKYPPGVANAPETVYLYGQYGNVENNSLFPPVRAHSQAGVVQGSMIVPRCKDGSTPQPGQNCFGNVPPAIVFLFIGFSNCDIEICGGNIDAWDLQTNPPHLRLEGQPCATTCPNPVSQPQQGYQAWNQPDSQIPYSLLYRVYHDNAVGQSGKVVFFDGAFGRQSLDKWDPTPVGYYSDPSHPCKHLGTVPECDYLEVASSLQANGFSEQQVQAIFLKSSTSFPQCDLLGFLTNAQQGHCSSFIPPAPLSRADVYQSEQYLGDILRYLKCCKPDSTPRYPNLHQVFLTTRIYGGYAINTGSTGTGSYAGCLSPEPYSYEESFAVQRLIVAQIKQTASPAIGPPDPYALNVNYNSAPWFDWGPYLWADAANVRQDGLFWCDTTSQTQSCLAQPNPDVRFGDLSQSDIYWGDHTHPTTQAAKKVAQQIIDWLGQPGNRNLWTPWLDAQ
jgi:hypothetical protein